MGIVGKQGLIAFHALNIYELETENELSDEILTTQTVLENIQQKFRNIMITDKVEIEKINLEYVPVLKNVEKGEYELKPMFVCMARQNYWKNTAVSYQTIVFLICRMFNILPCHTYKHRF